ncbi:hypothetical protein VPH35_048906 [Triticum aestivum]
MSPPRLGYKRRPLPAGKCHTLPLSQKPSPPFPPTSKANMAERFPGDGAAANRFSRRLLQELEPHLLYEAEYPAPPDMRVPGASRLSTGGVPVPPVPKGAARRAEIARIRSSLTEEQRNQPRYAPDSETLWTVYFQRRREEQIASVNGVIPRGRLNAEGRHEGWGIHSHTLKSVLDNIETGNMPRLEYPTRPSFSRRRGSSWTPRQMELTSSSSGSGSLSSGSPKEAPQRRRTRSGALVINEGGRPFPRSLRLVRPKPEPGLLPVKPEHADMVAPDDESALKWAKEDYIREQVRRQHQAYAELQARRRGCEEGGVIVLDSDEEECWLLNSRSKPPRNYAP